MFTSKRCNGCSHKLCHTLGDINFLTNQIQNIIWNLVSYLSFYPIKYCYLPNGLTNKTQISCQHKHLPGNNEKHFKLHYFTDKCKFLQEQHRNDEFLKQSLRTSSFSKLDKQINIKPRKIKITIEKSLLSCHSSENLFLLNCKTRIMLRCMKYCQHSSTHKSVHACVCVAQFVVETRNSDTHHAIQFELNYIVTVLHLKSDLTAYQLPKCLQCITVYIP